jgi:hypothetical protein
MADEDGSPYDFASPVPPKRPGESSRKAGPPQPAAPPEGGAPAETVKAEETERYCPYCGFMFRGKVKARCPECSAPMDSPTDLYQFAEAGWVRGCATGLMLITAGIALHVAGAVLWWIGTALSTGLTHMAGAVVVAVGVMLAMRQERPLKFATWGEVPAPKPSALAPWVKMLALASLALWLAAGILTLRAGEEGSVPKWPLILVLLCQAVLAALLAYVASGMATRVPSDTLASHTTHAGWATAIVCLNMLLLQGMGLVAPSYLMWFMFSFPLIAGFAGILGWAVVTLLRLALEMRAAAAAGAEIAARRAQRMVGRKAAPV